MNMGMIAKRGRITTWNSEGRAFKLSLERNAMAAEVEQACERSMKQEWLGDPLRRCHLNLEGC